MPYPVTIPDFTDLHLRSMFARYKELPPRTQVLLGDYLAAEYPEDDISREDFVLKLALVLADPSLASEMQCPFHIENCLTLVPEERMRRLSSVLTELYARDDVRSRAGLRASAPCAVA